MPRPGENYNFVQFVNDCQTLANRSGIRVQVGFFSIMVYEDEKIYINVRADRTFLFDKTGKGLLKIDLTDLGNFNMVRPEIREHVLLTIVQINDVLWSQHENYFGWPMPLYQFRKNG